MLKYRINMAWRVNKHVRRSNRTVVSFSFFYLLHISIGVINLGLTSKI